ncbi:MAG: AAA family ATPase [Planctomycetota bacterium]|jgi:MoxR-like ATPase
MPKPLADQVQAIIANIERVIKGKRETVELAVLTLLARGHLLLEDVPGTGKTTLARAISHSFGGTSSRVQFTPDLLPSDITGINLYNQERGCFEFQPGPIFCQVLLADEINRGTPRTQSSLLESMQEGTVTIDGEVRNLFDPFFVVATQNPVEFQGTYPLPEAQLDRFTMKLSMGYPERKAESEAILGQLQENPLDALGAVVSAEEVLTMQKEVASIHIDRKLMDYILDIVERTRSAPHIRLGSSPRGSLCLTRAAQAHSALEGRNYVSPYDVKRVATPVLAHRILLAAEAMVEGVNAEEVIAVLVDEVPVPAMGRAGKSRE